MKNSRLFAVAALSFLFLLPGVTGCTSIRSTLVDRGPDGKFSGHQLSTKVKGVPVKLKVPTHVEVRIEEVFYVDEGTGQVLFPEKRILEVADPVTIYEYQLFSVDVVRPFAGTLDLFGNGGGYELDPNQQISALGGKVTDSTISEIADVVGSKGFRNLLAGRQSTGTVTSGLLRQSRVVASRRFDIALPDWHLEMNDWVDSYMQHCNTTCPMGVAPCANTGCLVEPLPVVESQ